MKNFTYLIFAVFIICFHNSGIARQNKIMAEHCRTIDSLLNILKTDKRDTTQINTLIILCRKYINNGNYDQAMQYAQQAKEQALKLDFKKGLGESYNIIGDIFWYKGNYVLSYGHYFNAMKIFEKLDDKIAIANCNRNIGWVYLDQKNYENDTNRFRFSLAHEIGHYVLHEKFYKDLKISNFSDINDFMSAISEEEYSYLEVQANKFGNYLLLPREELKKIRQDKIKEAGRKHNIKNIDEKTVNAYLAGDVSPRFLVSSGAAEIALNDLINSEK